MLAIKGNELSSTDHIGSFFSDLTCYSRGQEKKALGDIKNADGLAMFYHPARYDRAVQWYVDIYKEYYNSPLIGMEAYNQDNRYTNCINIWDSVNAVTVPDIVVFGYSNDDMHVAEDQFHNYQFMLMDELTEESLRNAMLRGAFYFCWEPMIGTSLPRISNIEIKDCGKIISITASNWDTITWKSNNGDVGTGNSIDLTTLDLNIEKFVRAELKNGNNITCTQPFVLQNEQ